MESGLEPQRWQEEETGKKWTSEAGEGEGTGVQREPGEEGVVKKE